MINYKKRQNVTNKSIEKESKKIEVKCHWRQREDLGVELGTVHKVFGELREGFELLRRILQKQKSTKLNQILN